MRNLWTIGADERARKGWSRRIALWLCIVLMLALPLAQIAHFHKDAVDADHCSICVVLQNAAPVVTAGAVVLLVALERTTIAALRPARITRPATSLYCRPPPTFLG